MHPLILGAGPRVPAAALALAIAIALAGIPGPAGATAAEAGATRAQTPPRQATSQAVPAAKAHKAPRQRSLQRSRQRAATQAVSSGGPGCPSASAALQELLLSANCSGCWSTTAPGASPADTWRLDWIVPAADDAPLSAAALGEATQRLQQLQRLQALTTTAPTAASAASAASAAPAAPSPPPAGAATVLVHPARPAASAPGRLEVASGPAWQGYLGAQLSFTLARNQALPEGSQAWLGLVERLPAGSEGSPQARDLVRSLAGPLPLYGLQPGQAHTHLQALRWPEGARPERLQARGWIEGPDGRVLLMSADRCPR